MESKEHWEKVYTHKTPEQLSLTQEVPQMSLNFIYGFQLSKNASIIDIGGGDSKLVDFLLQDGYTNITVLDISAAAIEKAKARLGENSNRVKWVVSDVTAFKTDEHYDLWHDRATFHFLTSTSQISAYLQIAGKIVNSYIVIGTFSENGPDKCSGLPIKQYTEDELQDQLETGFNKIECFYEDHITPFKSKQKFLFCSFKKNN